jgi:hypothetical protein
VEVGIGTLRFDPPRLRGPAITEFMNVEMVSISFTIVASHAGNEVTGNIDFQKKCPLGLVDA